MKKLLFLALIIGATLSSCSKKSSPQPTSQKPTTATVPTVSVTTFAGGGLNASTDGTGTSAQFCIIAKLTSDKAGNIYVLEGVDTSNNLYFKIRKVTPSGTTSTLFNGGAETFVNNQPVEKTKVYHIYDIASDPSGNLYVRANLTDYSTTYPPYGYYYQEVGIYKLNASTSNLDVVSVSSSTLNFYPTLPADYNNLNSIAADASGNVYGAYITGDSTTTGSANIYKINTGGGTLFATINNLFPVSLYAEGNGNLYAITNIGVANTGVTKITGTQTITSLYTFPNNTLITAPIIPLGDQSEFLLGNQSGTLYGYGTLYNSSKEPIGIGFYKLTVNGTVSNSGIFSSDPGIEAAVADESGNIYFAVRFPTTNNSGGWIIQKVNLN